MIITGGRNNASKAREEAEVQAPTNPGQVPSPSISAYLYPVGMSTYTQTMMSCIAICSPIYSAFQDNWVDIALNRQTKVLYGGTKVLYGGMKSPNQSVVLWNEVLDVQPQT